MVRGVGSPVRLDDIETLADEIGPRPGSSPAEARAAAYVSERLTLMGIPNAIIPTRALSGASGLYVLPMLAMLLSLPLAIVATPAGFILSVVAAVLAAFEGTSRPLLSRLFRSAESHSVVGLIQHNPPEPEAQGTEPARRVIFVSHLDSPTMGWLDGPPLVNFVRGRTILMLIAMAAIPALLGGSLLTGSIAPLIVAAIPGAVVFIGLVLVLQRDIAGQPSVGRNKNASGVATALALADELRRYPPLHVETLMLFTGSSQAGSSGVTSFLAENRFNPETTYFIVLDSVGASPICFTRGEGPVLPLESSAALVHISGDIALSNPERAIRPIVHRGMPTEQYAILIRGYQAVAVIGRPDRAPANRRRVASTEDVDSEALEAAYLLAYGMIRRLDEEVMVSLMSRGLRTTAHAQ